MTTTASRSRRIDPGTGLVVATARLGSDVASSVDGLATDGTHLWLVTSGAVLDIDGTSLAVTRRVDVAAQIPGTVRGAVTAGGAVWVLADDGAALVRVGPATPRTSVAVRIFSPAPRRFRTPASLVTDGTRVWAMVQRPGGAHAVRVVGYDVDRDARVVGVDLPGALFAGAAAVT